MRTAMRYLPLFFLIYGLASTGCGVIGSASATPTPTVTPTSTPTPTPTPELETAILEVPQGGVLVLSVRAEADSAVASFAGRDHPLLPKEGGFWGVLGVDAQHATGAFTADVSLRDGNGRLLATLTARITVTDAGYPEEALTVPPELSGLLDPALAAQEAATLGPIFAVFTPERLWSGLFLLPVSGILTSPYGSGRSYNGGPIESFHSGADFALAVGTPVAGTPIIAANAGRIAFTGELPIRGVSVIIDHGAGVFSGYHHLESTTVQPGQPVAAGDLVGYLGSSGRATGPHLHWEVVAAGVAVDPIMWTEREFGP